MTDKKTLREAVMQNPDAVPYPYGEILRMDGFDALCAICDLLGGAMAYIPQKRSIFRKCLEQSARAEFDGKNFQALRRKYGYSESHMRKLLKAKKEA